MENIESSGWESDLARLEQSVQALKRADVPMFPKRDDPLCINPTVSVLVMGWTNLCDVLYSAETASAPEKEDELILLFKKPGDGA
ncbi:MAG: hypothetical protein KAR01_07470, partial [Desulfocapsa sp.]|nr:hypothetical protein [Desulfocapsa sp.]